MTIVRALVDLERLSFLQVKLRRNLTILFIVDLDRHSKCPLPPRGYSFEGVRAPDMPCREVGRAESARARTVPAQSRVGFSAQGGEVQTGIVSIANWIDRPGFLDPLVAGNCEREVRLHDDVFHL